MSSTKVLIDTNVLIALEDPGQTKSIAADFARRCQSGGVMILLHPATRADFDRDRDATRRGISSSRMDKYPCLADIPLPRSEDLQKTFGKIRGPNDFVDVALLHALSIDAVDLLVSQDEGLHRRVRGTALEERVMFLADAVAWLRGLQDPVDDGLWQVSDLPAYAIATNDPIFAGLRDDYGPFDTWWRVRCVGEHRDCWTVAADGGLDGLVVRKTELGEEIGLAAGSKVLKLCTFKVAARARGHKVGELLLRKALWHAQQNGFDAIYLTAFAKQEMLIDLLTRYGFERRGENAGGEGIFVKAMGRQALEPEEGVDLAALARKNYPRFTVRSPVNLHAVPVRWTFHRQLFPEVARLRVLPLFNDTTFDDRASFETAGNTIRKVYVCHSRNTSLRDGDVLFFYQSKDVTAYHSQCMTTVGVVERVRRATDDRELARYTAGRSVFSESDLKELVRSATNGVMVIDFLLVGHLKPPIPLRDLVRHGVLSAAPQSITKIERRGLKCLLPSMDFGFAF